MTEDWIYRLFLLGIVVSATSIALFHRYRAGWRSDRPVDYRAEGIATRWFIRLSAMMLWLTTLGYLLWPPCVAWAQVATPMALRWLAGILSVPVLFLMSHSLSALGSNLTDTVIVREKGFLVTTGPYAWVRHPYYVSAFGLIVVTAILASNWAIGFSGMLLVSVLVFRLGNEEAALRAKYGKAYDEYREKTGAFFPNAGAVMSLFNRHSSGDSQ